MWKAGWRAAGFDPQIIDEHHARMHPDYEVLKERYVALPTVNPKAYEVACFLRFLAMAMVGGGRMTDYDVLLISASPSDGLLNGDNFTCADRHVPSYVTGRASEWDRVARLFAELPWEKNPKIFRVNGKPHVSDMHALSFLLEHGEIQYEQLVVPGEFFTKLRHPSWSAHNCSSRVNALAIHFSHHATEESLRQLRVNGSSGRDSMDMLPAAELRFVDAVKRQQRSHLMEASLPILREVSLHSVPPCTVREVGIPWKQRVEINSERWGALAVQRHRST